MAIYRSGIIGRRADITPEQFRRHWIEIHGSLAAKLPGLGEYRQNHIRHRFHESLGEVQNIDGISQLRFDTIEDMETAENSAEYAETKLDIPRFQSGISILVLDPTIIVPRNPQARSSKLLWLSKRRLDVVDRSRWSKDTRSAIAEHKGVLGITLNCVVDTSHPVHAGVPAGDPSSIATITEVWLDEAIELQRFVEEPSVRELIFDHPEFAPIAVYDIEEIKIV